MSIYQIDTEFIGGQLTPPKLRKFKMLSWIKTLLSAIQKYWDNSFVTYQSGDSSLDWDVLVTYNFGERVVWTDKCVYECTALYPDGSPAGVLGTNPSYTYYWTKINSNFIGCDERIKYNSQRLLFEYALNRFFIPSTANLIYITNNFIAADLIFVMGNDGTYSSAMPNSSPYQVNFMPNDATYVTNTGDFTIFIFAADYTALGVNAEYIIRSFADRYVLAGAIYDIQTY